MKCEYCGEEDESRLGLWTRTVESRIETNSICISCMGKRLMDGEMKNENELPEEKSGTGKTVSK